MYCVEWNTLNAKPARKSRGDNKPATGLNENPVQSFKKLDMSSSCGILSSLLGYLIVYLIVLTINHF